MAKTESGTAARPQSHKNRRYASSSDWARHRPLITQLYRDERRTLGEVSRILETEYGFYATVRMYKKRLEEWGLGKKLKEDEVLQILRVLSIRGHNAMPVTFYINGRPIDNVRIQSYLNRKPNLIQRLRAGVVPSAEAIQVVTYQETADPCRSIATGSGSNAGPDGVMENLLKTMRLYVLGCLDSKTWISDLNGCWSPSLSLSQELKLHEDFHSSFVQLVSSLKLQAPPDEFGTALHRMFNLLPRLLKTHPPYFLASLLTMLPRLYRFKQLRLGERMVKHALELAKIYLGKDHAICEVLNLTGQLLVEADIGDYLQPVKLLLQTFEDHVGPNNSITRLVGVTYASALVLTAGWIDQGGIRVLQKYVAPVANFGEKTLATLDQNYDAGIWNIRALRQQDRLPFKTRQTVGNLLAEVLPRGPPKTSATLDLGPSLQRIAANNLARRHVKFTLAYGQVFSEYTVMEFCNTIAKIVQAEEQNRSIVTKAPLSYRAAPKKGFSDEPDQDSDHTDSDTSGGTMTFYDS
ncbi:Clr5 domain-containing protein [Xylariales sp. PMI_506]|nr:Clr5 domain-containing protein [Xylariales sp. PMI_506]